MTKKVGSYVPVFLWSKTDEEDIEVYVDEFWHLFEEEAEEILVRLERL